MTWTLIEIKKLKEERLNEVKEEIGDDKSFLEEEWNGYLEELDKLEISEEFSTDKLWAWYWKVLCEWRIKILEKKLNYGYLYGSTLITKAINECIAKSFRDYDEDNSLEENMSILGIEGQNYWKDWIRSGHSGMSYWGKRGRDKQERAEEIEKALEKVGSSEELANKVWKKARNYYEFLEIPVARPSLTDPFPGEKVPIADCKKILRQLDLFLHPDKGQCREWDKKFRESIFNEAQEVKKCLSNPHNKQKYDFYLYERVGNMTTNEFFIPNKEDLKEFEKFREVVVNEELIQKFTDLFHNELQAKKISQTEINEYCQRLYGEDAKSFEEEMKDCLSKPLWRLRNHVSRWLGIIKEAFWAEQQFNRTGIPEDIENRLTDKKYLGTKPTLTKEELDNFPEENLHDQVLQETRKKFFELTTGFHRKKLYETVPDLELITEKLKKRILVKRKCKEKLLNELGEWLDKGNKITDFKEGKEYREEFKNYLSSISASDNYEVKVIGKSIHENEDNKQKIDNLISRLESLEEEETTKDNDFAHDETPISEVEKKLFIDFCNELVFKMSPTLPKVPSILMRIKRDKGLELDYQQELKSAKNKGAAEIIRVNLIREICGKIGGEGGSDNEKVKKIKDINRSLAGKLIQEIEQELGIKFVNLPKEKQQLLTRLSGSRELSQVDFSRELARRKREILSSNDIDKSDNGLETKINNAISSVNNYWEKNQAEKDKNGEINGRNKEQVIGAYWEAVIRAKIDEEEIKRECDNRKKLIDEEKIAENAEKERLAREREAVETAEREKQEKIERETREIKYSELLAEVKNATTIEAVNNLNEKINNFNYDDLGAKNLSALQKVQKQRKVKIWQKAAKKAINNCWKENQNDEQKINKEVITGVLGKDWKNSLLTEDTEDKINKKRDDLITLIQAAKNVEKKIAALTSSLTIRDRRQAGLKLLQVAAVDKVKSHWNTQKRKDNTINGENQAQILGENWENDFSTFNAIKKIGGKSRSLIALIDEKKKVETTVIEQTIDSINKHWSDNADSSSSKINDKNKNTILGEEWEKILWEEILMKDLVKEEKKLIKKIDKVKNEEKEREEERKLERKIENFCQAATKCIDGYWTEKIGIDVGKGNYVKSKDDVLDSDWKEKLKNLGDIGKIEERQKQLTGLIDTEKEQRKTIKEVRKKWKDENKDGKINWKDRNCFIPTGTWKERIASKLTIPEIDAERKTLLDLMVENKRIERIKEKAIEEVENHWKSKSDESNKINGESIDKILDRENWKKSIQKETNEANIKNWRDEFIDKIENFKKKKNNTLRKKSNQEKELGKHLKKLWKGERTRSSWTLPIFAGGNFSKDVEEWFNELITLFANNTADEKKSDFLKEICGKVIVSDHAIEKKLRKEKSKLTDIDEEKLKKSIKNNPFFKKIDWKKEEEIVSQYLQEIVNNSKEEISLKIQTICRGSQARKRVKKLKEIAQVAELAKWDQIKNDIETESNLNLLVDDGEWDKKIQALQDDLLPTDKQKALLTTRRQANYTKLLQIAQVAELAKWDQIKNDIETESNLNLLVDDGEWDKKIQALQDDLLPTDKQKALLTTRRQSCHNQLLKKEKKKKEGISSLLDKVKKFASHLEELPQEEINDMLELFTEKIGEVSVDSSAKEKSKSKDEREEIGEAIAELITGIKKVETSINIFKKAADEYLKAENEPKEKYQDIYSEAEKSKTSQAVSQCMKRLISRIYQSTELQPPNKEKYSPILIIGTILGLFAISVLGYSIFKRKTKQKSRSKLG